MDENIDRCIPFGTCGSYGAPFKRTCFPRGYTVVGKGTTSGLWQSHVSREAEIYQILRKVQGSAVPVFLGKMDLAKFYFLHGAGQIRHMLVMGWAGESIAELEQTPELLQRVERSKKKIRALGVRHMDLRPDNILWNAELGRALIIDFHRCELARRPLTDRSRSIKRPRSKVHNLTMDDIEKHFGMPLLFLSLGILVPKPQRPRGLHRMTNGSIKDEALARVRINLIFQAVLRERRPLPKPELCTWVLNESAREGQL
ncbi:hypothetical protein BDV30DRAFT_236105 [Aspergillus minisclerotigenes]|uniref:Protein kinase domain-containing protein n=1 Tax=Aspergillus minisclerotigenes TaxID=656917 RepID=A0A5N6JAE7_9EURO|nr:hypothetical protein BDV30DRAFT_236105 [Aspergillus minisclerotigenes]